MRYGNYWQVQVHSERGECNKQACSIIFGPGKTQQLMFSLLLINIIIMHYVHVDVVQFEVHMYSMKGWSKPCVSRLYMWLMQAKAVDRERPIIA